MVKQRPALTESSRLACGRSERRLSRRISVSLRMQHDVRSRGFNHGRRARPLRRLSFPLCPLRRCFRPVSYRAKRRLGIVHGLRHFFTFQSQRHGLIRRVLLLRDPGGSGGCRRNRGWVGQCVTVPRLVDHPELPVLVMADVIGTDRVLAFGQDKHLVEWETQQLCG